MRFGNCCAVLLQRRLQKGATNHLLQCDAGDASPRAWGPAWSDKGGPANAEHLCPAQLIVRSTQHMWFLAVTKDECMML